MTVNKTSQRSVAFVNFKRRYNDLSAEINMAVQEVLASGAYILGPTVEAFEDAMAKYLGCKHAIGVANGTDALILALKAFEIGLGDEVIIPVNSFIASAGAVAAVGATPVFCDVNEDLNIDVSLLSSLITKNTKAIMPVHLTGRPAQMDVILDFARKNGLVVIEDAAQSIGAKYKNVMTGTIGEIGCFSLHPLKNLHAYGDAGLITTNDTALYNKINLLRNHGLRDRDTCVCWGLNSRIDAIQAAIAMVGLRYLPEWTRRRQLIASQYRRSLKSHISTPVDTADIESVYHNFVVLTEHRDKIMFSLEELGIETKIHYPVPLHMQPAASSLGYKKGSFKVAESLAQRMLSLPVYPELMDDEVLQIIEGINSIEVN